MVKITNLAGALALGASTASAQTFKTYTDDNGIEFWQSTFETSVGDGGAQFGLALPAAAQSGFEEEYIGHLVVPKGGDDGTWMGLSHMSGMTGSLLLLSWLDGDEIMTSFRYASGYTQPDIYNGNATLSKISQNINDTHFELTYRCENCWSWDHEGATGDQIPATTSSAVQIIGWAQATQAPNSPSDADSDIKQHDDDGIFGAAVGSARNSAYTSWVSLATATSAPATATATPTGSTNGTGSAGPTATATPTAAACPSANTMANSTWDYIIVGAGAGGIPLADKLSEDGSSVLLIEKGPASSGRWGGTMRPEWLVGSNLTRFDVPGLDNQIWKDSEGIACEDYSVMAGCVLGGGTAVNAGLWWKANPEDFDYNFPEGWKSSDMQSAVDRTFERIPFTDHPSMDGIIYKPQGYNIVSGALAAAGWENVTADEVPGKKNHTFSRPNHMFSNGERGGPMATYLVSASERKNFQLITNTTVPRVIRDGSHITGVETEAFLDGGMCGEINVTPGTGKVILSAGAFGTPKILFRSGIGPQDQLEIVQKAEGSAMVGSSDWINLPVGHNLDDHTNTDIVITHPNVSFYDFYAAYNNPIKSDAESYLNDRTGILAQSAPNLSVLFWEEILGDDGIVRQMQYTARVEGGHGISSNQSMVISQYLGRGKTSRGRTVINGALDMTVSQVPYLNNEHDISAVAAGIESLKAALSKDPQIKIVFPAANTSTEDFLADYATTTGSRSANHWMGSCKMGPDSGLDNGTSVVDTDTKVYGTDNLFVVDASIFPGMVSTNPSALIVAVAEKASGLIADAKVEGNPNQVSASAPFPLGNSTSPQGTGMPSGTGLPYSTGVSFAPSATSISSKCTSDVTITRTRKASSQTALVSTQAVETAARPATSSAHSTFAMPADGFQPSNGTLPSATGTAPTATGTAPTASGTAPVASGTAPTASSILPTATGALVEPWGRCGGTGYTGSKQCADGWVCKEFNPYYSQCVKAGSG
ncbi:cellobiose dehydrogenase [Hortaea werneckii]|nr:cellobiose dehydrogenase [Hortaea werneckii]